MEIGPFIKLHRIEQGMTQEELASGLVSMSYLSKIENQRTSASTEIISELCTRLGVQLDSEKDLTIREKCKKWYKMLYEVNDKEEVISAHNEIKEIIAKTHYSSSVMFEIYRVRYFLVIGEYSNALEQINKLNEVSNSFDSLHQFYWYKFKGNYNTVTNDFNHAMRMYKLAEEILNQLELSEDEVSDLQYTLAVTHSKLRNTLEAIDYADKALHAFMQNYNFIRCAECHIILGISYRRIKMYDKAIKNYNLAKHLGELNRNKQIIQLANQNLGYLHSTKGNKREAIQHYVEVVNDVEVNLNARLTATTSLIKEYYLIGNIDNSKEMIKKGFELLDKENDSEEYKIHYYVINTYNYAINNDNNNFETLVINEFIPYLKKHKDYANLVVYANMLGNYFEKLTKYKGAVSYYKLANFSYKELISL